MREPSTRKLAGTALILLLIVFWAAFVASLAPVVGTWPILVGLDYPLETFGSLDPDGAVHGAA
jgi:hypothetical protein